MAQAKSMKARDEEAIIPDNNGFIVRDIGVEDFEKGIMSLLGQLTEVGDVTKTGFDGAFQERAAAPDVYKTIVIEDVTKQKVIATVSIIFERKFIRNCGKVAHIEDVVVDNAYRKHGLGRRIVTAAVEAAREAGCYKVILDCSESNAPFYEACGFKRKDLQMAQYFV
eukprot:jgi/Botrbrau1/22325/Bobra.0002s0005.1